MPNRIPFRDRHITVVEIDPRGLCVVDPAFQPSENGRVLVWIARDNSEKILHTQYVRFDQPSSREAVTRTADSYRAYREDADRTPEERHKARLEKLGRKYQGVRLATHGSLRRRITHCYNCKHGLDNSIDIECIACGWILCKCGACGCGYSAGSGAP